MQIKVTMRPHLTPGRVAGIKEAGNNWCWWGCEEQGPLIHSGVGEVSGSAFMENIQGLWEIAQGIRCLLQLGLGLSSIDPPPIPH